MDGAIRLHLHLHLRIRKADMLSASFLTLKTPLCRNTNPDGRFIASDDGFETDEQMHDVLMHKLLIFSK